VIVTTGAILEDTVDPHFSFPFLGDVAGLSSSFGDEWDCFECGAVGVISSALKCKHRAQLKYGIIDGDNPIIRVNSGVCFKDWGRIRK
jgi:hypothetical protein